MKAFVEIGRFFQTAIVVALVLPLGIIVSSGFAAGSFALWPIYSVIAFVLCAIGGALVGLPVLWIASRQGWSDSMARMTVAGSLAGAFAAALILLLYSWGNSGLLMVALLSWSALGAFAGAIAAPFWVFLHSDDAKLSAP